MGRMSMVEKLKIFYDQAGEELIALKGLDKAVIGIEEHDMRLVYSRKKIIKILMDENKWDEELAREFFEFNIWPLYFGRRTPIFCLDDI